jgi:hypothetical protein
VNETGLAAFVPVALTLICAGVPSCAAITVLVARDTVSVPGAPLLGPPAPPHAAIKTDTAPTKMPKNVLGDSVFVIQWIEQGVILRPHVR